MEKENREYKDSLFVDLFYRDEKAKENLLSLYNALNDTDLCDEALIRKVGLEEVLYKNFKNDISFEVSGKVVVFGEHQSTVNPNMPLRCLMYAGRAYEQLVDDKDRYKTKLVKIPTPEFYIFYNGKAEYPLEQELRLSDAFENSPKTNSLELKVTAVNINIDKGHEILEKCKILREYSVFIDTVRKYEGEENAIKRAINECIENGILADYLSRKGSEVRNMLLAEYSYETDIMVKQEEAWQEGKQEGIQEGVQEGMQKGKQETLTLTAKVFQELRVNPAITSEQLAEKLECPISEIENIRKVIGI